MLAYSGSGSVMFVKTGSKFAHYSWQEMHAFSCTIAMTGCAEYVKLH